MQPEGVATVVVCTHSRERLELLVGLVASIRTGSRAPAEIIVVVDRNPSLLRELKGREWGVPVLLLPSPGSGLAAARNAGWRAASSPLVAFIDDDAIASPTWLQDLLEARQRHGADIVGGRIDPRWTDGEPAWYSPLLGWVVGCTYEGMPTEPSRVRNVIGCNMLFGRDVLEQLGGFDPALGRSGGGLAGCEETELCIRATKAGASVFLVPGAAVEQVLPSNRATLGYAVRRSWHEGRSKHMLVDLHGPVLGTEARYARQLVVQAMHRLCTGVLKARGGDLLHATGLLAVLASTSASYVLHRLRAAPVRLASRMGVA